MPHPCLLRHFFSLSPLFFISSFTPTRSNSRHSRNSSGKPQTSGDGLSVVGTGSRREKMRLPGTKIIWENKCIPNGWKRILESTLLFRFVWRRPVFRLPLAFFFFVCEHINSSSTFFLFPPVQIQPTSFPKCLILTDKKDIYHILLQASVPSQLVPKHHINHNSIYIKIKHILEGF